MTLAARAPIAPPSQRADKTPRTKSDVRWLCPALVTLAAGVTLTAVLGPLTGGPIRYHVSFDAINQVIGGDLVAVALVAPVSLLAAILAWRRHPAAPVIALGPAVFAVYTYTQLAIGGDFARYEGNSERIFVLHLALFVLGGAIALKSWADAVRRLGTQGGVWRHRLVRPSRVVRRRHGRRHAGQR